MRHSSPATMHATWCGIVVKNRRPADCQQPYLRARWYDAEVGRWISEDPIGFAAGDGNLVRYAENVSIASIDPSGLTEVAVANNQSEPETTGQGTAANGYIGTGSWRYADWIANVMPHPNVTRWCQQGCIGLNAVHLNSSDPQTGRPYSIANVPGAHHLGRSWTVEEVTANMEQIAARFLPSQPNVMLVAVQSNVVPAMSNGQWNLNQMLSSGNFNVASWVPMPGGGYWQFMNFAPALGTNVSGVPQASRIIQRPTLPNNYFTTVFILAPYANPYFPGVPPMPSSGVNGIPGIHPRPVPFVH